jgi:hypothetical protein
VHRFFGIRFAPLSVSLRMTEAMGYFPIKVFYAIALDYKR